METKETREPIVDPSEYKVVDPPVKEGGGKVRKESPRPMGIDQYLEEAGKELHLLPLQITAFSTQYRGKIFPYTEWKDLIHIELTRRTE